MILPLYSENQQNSIQYSLVNGSGCPRRVLAAGGVDVRNKGGLSGGAEGTG